MKIFRRPSNASLNSFQVGLAGQTRLVEMHRSGKLMYKIQPLADLDVMTT